MGANLPAFITGVAVGVLLTAMVIGLMEWANEYLDKEMNS